MKKVLIPILVILVITTFYLRQPRTEEVKLSAWAVFQTYLDYAKEGDLEAIKILSYQVSDDCKTEPVTDKCKERMSTAHFFGSQFRLEDLKHTAFDEKQIILATDYFKNRESNAASITRGVIYFVRDGEEIKFLSLNPFDGTILTFGNEATSTIEAKLDELAQDTDLDFLRDQDELCSTGYSDCIKSNPDKRDTDKDGFWDSIEALFYKS